MPAYHQPCRPSRVVTVAVVPGANYYVTPDGKKTSYPVVSFVHSDRAIYALYLRDGKLWWAELSNADTDVSVMLAPLYSVTVTDSDLGIRKISGMDEYLEPYRRMVGLMPDGKTVHAGHCTLTVPHDRCQPESTPPDVSGGSQAPLNDGEV